MKVVFQLLPILAFSTNIVNGFALNKPDQPHKVVNLDIVGKSSHHRLYPRNIKRQKDHVSVPLSNLYFYYKVDVKIGTPAQSVELLIDTGSSDMWVYASDNPYCATTTRQLNDPSYIDCRGATFNYNDSSTFHYNNSDFLTQYKDFTAATGIWGTDVVNIGGVNINNCSFATADLANSSQAVLGIGFSYLEETAAGLNDAIVPYSYSNIPQLLKGQGHIDHIAYSLWLNDLESTTGQRLFGGVDHDKYEGTLSTVPMINSVPTVKQPIEMTVALSGIEMSDAKGKVSTVMTGPITALLDSGATTLMVPENIANVVYETLGAEYDDDYDLYTVDCNVRNGNTTFIFNFSGAKITVPISQIVVPLADLVKAVEGEQVGSLGIDTEDAKNTCILEVLPTDDIVILGDPFLRSAYVVYDLDNFEISLANTKYNVSSSNIEVIEDDGIPDAERAPNFSETQVYSTAVVNTGTGVFTAPSSVGSSK